MEMFDYVSILTYPLIALGLFNIYSSIYDECLYGGSVEKISYLIFVVFMGVTTIFFSKPIIFMIVNILSFFFISFNYEKNVIFKIINSIFAYIFLLIIDVIITMLTGLTNINPFHENEYNSIFGVILIRIIWVVLTNIFNRYKSNSYNTIKLPLQYYLSILAVLVGTLYLFIKLLSFEEATILDLIVSIIFVLTINTIIIVLFENLYKLFTLKIETNILIEQTRAYENQNEVISSATETLSSLKHDIKNHISILCELNRNGKIKELQEYISNMQSQINEIDNISRSNNFIFDSILNLKLKNLEDIDLTVEIDVPNNIEILAYDLMVILGNLLDNSLEALYKLEKNRVLKITSKISKENLLIFIDNSFNNEISFQNGNFLSTKKNKDNHGIGLKNVKKVLKSYGGYLNINYTKEIFSVTIVIPC